MPDLDESSIILSGDVPLNEDNASKPDGTKISRSLVVDDVEVERREFIYPDWNTDLYRFRAELSDLPTPVQVYLDVDFEDAEDECRTKLHAMYNNPFPIFRKDLVDSLLENGIREFETHPVCIMDASNLEEVFADYCYLKPTLYFVHAVNEELSEKDDGIYDLVVIDNKKVSDSDIFLHALNSDGSQNFDSLSYYIAISKKVKDIFEDMAPGSIYFEPQFDDNPED